MPQTAKHDECSSFSKRESPIVKTLYKAYTLQSSKALKHDEHISFSKL